MTTPTINVNLKPCPIGSAHQHRPESTCAGKPVLIPCPIPRSVTFQVVLGDCACNATAAQSRSGLYAEHLSSCPSRPVKVSCSISSPDGSWEKSDVVSTEMDLPAGAVSGEDWFHACRARWALVKALVLGWDGEAVRAAAVSGGLDLEKVGPMFQQMRTVYAALADMTLAEEAMAAASARVMDAVGERRWPWGRRDREAAGTEAPSARALTAYVGHLLEQICILNGGT